MLWAGLRSRRTEILAGFGVGTESEFKTAVESEKMPDSKYIYIYIYIYIFGICALYMGKTIYKYQLTGFAILGCLTVIYILCIYNIYMYIYIYIYVYIYIYIYIYICI